MATLQSPGVQVTVIDESFYTPAAPGTVPLIVVASGQDKQNASKTGTAQGTTKANAGKVWTITSQRDLTDTFGTPKFYTDASGNPVHGGELNEYGLQAAYSLLGVSSRAYVVRADMNLDELQASGSIPKGDPISGTYWLDSDATLFGVNEWDAVNSVFTLKTPLVIDDTTTATNLTSLVPNTSFGNKGNYAVVATSDNTGAVYYKNQDNIWVIVGSNDNGGFSNGFSLNSWQSSWPAVTSSGFNAVSTGSTFAINGQTITIGASVTPTGLATTINGVMSTYGVGARVNSTSGKLELFADAKAKSNGTNKDGKVTLSATTASVLTSLGLTAGTYLSPVLTIAPHTSVPQYGTTGAPSGSVYIKTTSPSKGASWIVKYYNGATESWGTVAAPIYASKQAAIRALDTAGGKNIAAGTLFVESNYNKGTGVDDTSPQQATFKVYRRQAVSPTTIVGESSVATMTFTFNNTVTTATYSLELSESVAGSAIMQNTSTILSVSGIATWNTSTGAVPVTTNVSAATLLANISGASLNNVTASVDPVTSYLTLNHTLGGEIHITEKGNQDALGFLGFTPYNLATKTGTANLYNDGDNAGSFAANNYVVSNWKPLVFESKADAPYTDPANGTLWYGSNLSEVDILYHNGTTWVGYRNATAFPNSDPNGPQVKASQPTTQSDGTDLVNGDIWVDSSDSEAYGQNVYVWNATTLRWVKQDVTDQESPTGWLFADARWAASGQAEDPATIKALLASNYIDPDAPDPALYPQGMRLWNLRRSGFNIKKYVVNHIDVNSNDGKNARFNDDPMDGSNNTTPYNPNRWVSASPNADDGSGTFGRKAQRSFVVAALKSMIDTNQDIRDTDTLVYNLIACPGYPEVTQNLIGLNADRGYTGFVIADTPFRLKSSGTELANWGSNTANATSTGEQGATANNEYMAFFYPSGFTNDNSGNKIVVPPSHMMLRTFATSDQKSYQWFAPAGIRRGAVDNATSVGYVENGEFKTVALTNSVRDVMIQTAKINPIANLNGVGLVNFGNLTRAKGTSSLDRINVARLVAYLRRQLDVLSRPFLFEPNDRNTRNEIKNAAESLLIELVGQRALYDFIVVCDEQNNTPTRIDRSELWMDIAIEPVKAVEFIYIPLRLKNTGDIKAGL